MTVAESALLPIPCRRPVPRLPLIFGRGASSGAEPDEDRVGREALRNEPAHEAGRGPAILRIERLASHPPLDRRVE